MLWFWKFPKPIIIVVVFVSTSSKVKNNVLSHFILEEYIYLDYIRLNLIDLLWLHSGLPCNLWVPFHSCHWKESLFSLEQQCPIWLCISRIYLFGSISNWIQFVFTLIAFWVIEQLLTTFSWCYWFHLLMYLFLVQLYRAMPLK